jgi:hypothetical protein
MPHARITIVRLDAGRPVPVTVARPGDELAALFEIDPGPVPAILTFEIYRGDTPRHRWSQRVEIPARLACRLHWRDRPAASSRLVVRVWGGKALLASRVVLLLPGQADAQGRLPDDSTPEEPGSARTRLAFQERFRDLLGEQG